jgi:sulfur carrier protein ThiS
MKTVTVGMVPGPLSQVAVEDDATVASVLAAADLDAAGLEIKLNGSAATLETRVSDGSRIFLVKKVKGNMKTVTVGMVPGPLSQVAVEDDATVAAVLEAADLDAAGLEIKLNGSAATLESRVSDGSRIFLVKKVKGN